MYQTHSIKWKPLIISLLISLGTGGISAAVTSKSMDIYKNIQRPPASPSGIVFPIVWTILFLLMGISSYLIFVSHSPLRNNALLLYAVQLIVNFIWPILFFNMQAYLAAFIWLVFLWILILCMIISFSKINKTAAYLQIPYLLWVTFAAYLNLSIYFLNK